MPSVWLFVGTLGLIHPCMSGELPLSTGLYPPGITDEGKYVKWLHEVHEHLQSEAEQDARFRGYLANWVIAVRCEPHISRAVLGVHREGDLETLERLCRQSLEQLSVAQTNEPDRDRRELLRGLAEAILEWSRAKRGQADSKRLDEVATALSFWVDDERQFIAETSRFWQALLYFENDKPDRSLSVLPLALEPVKGSRVAFYMRLQRTVVLSSIDRAKLALVQLLKMEERAAEWFNDSESAHAVLCTLTWLRARIARMKPEGNLGALATETRQQWISRADEFLSDSEQPCTLLRMGPIVPLLYPEPEGWKPPPVPPSQAEPVPDTQPAANQPD